MPDAKLTDREARERLEFLAWLLDSSIPLPGTRFTIGLDALVGLVPFLGDAFDAGWKCNQKNVRLLGAWLDNPHRAQRGNRAFVALLVLALAAFVALCFAGVYWLFTVL